jgi:Bacterial SH3 domain
MKKRTMLVFAASLLLGWTDPVIAGTARADWCVVADPTNTPLNVRKDPSASARILGALNNGTRVSTGRTRGNWVSIVPHGVNGKSGWVWREHLDCSESIALPDGAGIGWNCDGTIVAIIEEDLGPTKRGASPIPEGDNDILTTVWVANPPARGPFVFKQYAVPMHAYGAWSAELNGKPCTRKNQ